MEAREHYDATEPKNRSYGLRVTIKEGGRGGSSDTAYLDYEEIEALLNGLDFVARADPSLSSLRVYEARYATAGWTCDRSKWHQT